MKIYKSLDGYTDILQGISDAIEDWIAEYCRKDYCNKIIMHPNNIRELEKYVEATTNINFKSITGQYEAFGLPIEVSEDNPYNTVVLSK